MKQTESAKTVATAGKIFHGGTAVELIRDSGYASKLKLLVWNGHAAKIVEQYAHDEAVYTPPLVHSSIRNSLVLPTRRAGFGSTRQLFRDIEAVVSRASGGNESIAKPLTFMVFATWLAEFAPVAPYIWVTAPPKSATAALQQILQLLCRHALLVNPLAANWPSTLPMALRPTLITVIDKPSRRLFDAFRASQTRGLYSTRTGEAVDPFCAKVIFAREPLQDPATAGFPLEIMLAPENKYVPPLNDSDSAHVAEEFQNKLLAYRLRSFSKVAPPRVELDRLSAPLQALAHTFAGAIVGDDDLQQQILPYLRELDAELQSDTETSVSRAIIEVLIAWRSRNEFPVTEITAYTNTLIAGRGSSVVLTPEAVGWKLRGFGLHTVHNSRGLKVLLMREAEAMILKIAESLSVAVPVAEGAQDGHRRAGSGRD